MAAPQRAQSNSESSIRKPTTTHRSPILTTDRWIALVSFMLGLVIFALGCYLETRNARSNAEDNFAWLLLGIGVSLGSFGVSLWFLRPISAFTLAVVAPPLAFCFVSVMFWVLLFADGFQNRYQQEFAANGVSQIAPARQMDELFNDCRHYVTFGQNNLTLFNSVAYFGDRYELTMQIPIDINSKYSGSAIGEPQFYLNEIREITISSKGKTEATFSRNLNFGSTKWAQLYNADGDFGEIGFTVNPESIPNFKAYTDKTRQSD